MIPFKNKSIGVDTGIIQAEDGTPYLVLEHRNFSGQVYISRRSTFTPFVIDIMREFGIQVPIIRGISTQVENDEYNIGKAAWYDPAFPEERISLNYY